MSRKFFLYPVVALFGLAAAVPAANAAIIISEVDSNGTDQTYDFDWIELTNTGSSGVDLTNWTVNDADGGTGTARLISGIGNLAAGQSALVFLEVAGSAFEGKKQDFLSAWFNNPNYTGLIIGYADGGGLGLNTNDAVNIWNATGGFVTSVRFPSPDSGLRTFDNAAGVSGTSVASSSTTVNLSAVSAVGVNGAFASLSGSNNEIGSPGSYPAPVPLPAAAWLLLSGLGGLGMVGRRRRAVV